MSETLSARLLKHIALARENERKFLVAVPFADAESAADVVEAVEAFQAAERARIHPPLPQSEADWMAAREKSDAAKARLLEVNCC